MSCNQEVKVNFSELSDSEKERIIIENILNEIHQNDSDLVFRNYFYLLEQSNKLKPCPENKFEKIRVYFKDSIFSELSVFQLTSYEYLKPDPELGEIDFYGIQFDINDTTGEVESYFGYINYTQWTSGEIGARKSISDKFVQYKTDIFDIEKKYSDNELLKQLNLFYETEMKQIQSSSKDQCD